MDACYLFKAIHTGLGDVVRDGVLAVRGGTICYVGDDLNRASGCDVHDCRNHVCIPGLVDAHSHIALYKEPLGESGNDYNEWNDQDISSRVLDAFDSFDHAIRRAVANGITTVCVTPGSGQVVNGYGEIFKLAGSNVDEMVIRPFALLKTALGENTIAGNRKSQRYPSTRMGCANVLRNTLRSVFTNHANDDRPIRAEADDLARRLRSGETRLSIHAHTPNDIVTGLRIGREFGLRPVFIHATGLHRVMDIVRPEDADFILGPFLYGNWKPELADLHPANMALLRKAGYRFAVSSDHPFTPCEYLLGTIVLAQAHGLEFGFGLQSVTSIPAVVLGIDGRVGCLRPGMDADFVILSGDPDCARSMILDTYINGVRVYSKHAP